MYVGHISGAKLSILNVDKCIISLLVSGAKLSDLNVDKCVISYRDIT